MLDGMSDSIQRSRIENLHSREVDRQSPTGLIFFTGRRPTYSVSQSTEGNYKMWAELNDIYLWLFEVCEVVPAGLAAQHGLPMHATNVDGSTNCNWWITEVNHRPLNLLYKDGEVSWIALFKNKITQITIAPYSRNFRGAGHV